MFPPMPWYRLTMISEDDFRSLYRYIKSWVNPENQFLSSFHLASE